MKNPLMTIILVLTFSVSTLAAVPTTMNYQGQLNDSEGNPVADGSYSVTFSLYDVPSGGTELWTESRTIETINGLFSIILGSINPITSAVVESAPRYLGITVEGDPEQFPRTELTSVPFALTTTSMSGPAGPQADTRHPHEGQDQGGDLGRGDLFPEKQGRQHHHPGGRGI